MVEQCKHKKDNYQMEELESINTMGSNYPADGYELCPDCHGSGSRDDNVCSSCNGKGLI